MEVSLESERGEEVADIDFTVAGSAADIISNASDLSGASGVIVADATGASSVDAVDGAALSELEVLLASDDSGADVEFRIEDSAGAIAAELSSDNTLLDGADDLVVDGGDTTVAGASDIQGVAEYDASGSAYTITDSASAILGDSGSVIHEAVTEINVDGPVGAGVGVQLGSLEDASFETGYSADLNYNVMDDAGAIATELAGDAGALDNAEHVVVDGGDTTVAGASDIQGVAEYDASGSAYTITDSASAILGDTGSVIHEAVTEINVDGPVGAGVGSQLNIKEDYSLDYGFSADINFSVLDDANEIAAVLQPHDSIDFGEISDVIPQEIKDTIYKLYNADNNGTWDSESRDYQSAVDMGIITNEEAVALTANEEGEGDLNEEQLVLNSILIPFLDLPG